MARSRRRQHSRKAHRQHSQKPQQSRPKFQRQLSAVQQWLRRTHRKRVRPVVALLKRVGRGTWAAVGIVALLLGLADATYTFVAKVSVRPSTQPDQRRPQSSFCILKNDSVLPIYSVYFRYRWKALRYINNDPVLYPNQWFEVGDSGQEPILPGFELDELAATQETTVPCSFLPGWEIFEKGMKLGEVGSATLLIDVSYKPKFHLWRSTKHFRFRANRDVNGNFDWVPEIP